MKGLTRHKGLALNVAICLNLWITDSTIGITVTQKRTERKGGGDGEGVMPDGLTMTTSSDLHLALRSAIASGSHGKMGGMGGMQGTAAEEAGGCEEEGS